MRHLLGDEVPAESFRSRHGFYFQTDVNTPRYSPFSTHIAGVPSPISGSGLGALPDERTIPMQFRPLHDRIVLRRIDAEAKSKGGIIIPDTAKEKPQEGEVVAVGPGVRDEKGTVQPLELKAGDRVLFGKWSGTEVKIDGEDLLIMKESDVLGVVVGAPALQKAA